MSRPTAYVPDLDPNLDLVLGRLYWFSVPYRCILLASVLYVCALATQWH